ncbi:beta strand repeat-containing protein, partial [Variovorax sp. LARHSF232]
AAETQEDTDFSGRVAATDADGDTLSYAVTTQPTHGTVTIDAATGAYTYTPTPDFNGSDSFVVTIADGNGGTAQTTVTMTVAAVADIAPDTVTTVEDTRVNIAVLGNDSFENSGRTIAMINGTAVTVGTPIAVSNGTVTLQSNGTLDFQPAANFNGATSFSYTVSSGGVTETASVTVNVTANNDTPVPLGPIPPTPGQTFDPATRNYAAETQEDTDFSGRVAATDADGDTLSYAVTTQPSHGTVTIDAATGAYTYTPTADFNGFDSFVVTISDGNGGTAQTTVTMTVAAVADIAADTVTTTEDMPINIAVLGNDTFENGGRSVTAINGAAVTVDTPVAVSNGMVTLLSNGTLDFQPTANFNGAASFSYTVTSGGVTETASVTVNVTANNDTPVPLEPIPPTPGQTFNPATGNYAAQTQEDTAFSGRVAATDADGDTLSYAVTTQPSHGTVTIDAATGAYTYTPTADFNGVDSFVVTVSDGHGGTVPATVTMTVAAATDIAPDTVTTTEDTLVNIAVLGNDMFENSGRSVTAINGTAVTVGTPIAVSNGMVTLKTDGTLDFTPTANFNGATSFSYTVSSGGVTETASVAVTVTGDNYTPVPLEPIPPTPGQTFDPSTRNYAAETLEDTAFNGRVAATDADGDTLSYAVTTRPSNGTVTIDAATGAYTYTPTADFNGSDSFVVTIADGKGGTAQTTVTMTVAAVADATIDSISTTEDRAVTVNVLTGTNGASADNFEDGARAVTAVTQGAHGSVSFNADGTVVYTPNANYNGPDSFSYTVTSGGVTETATVTVNVTTDNDTPVPSEPIPPTPGQTFDPATGNYAAETQEDVAFSGRVAATDADGDTLSYTVSTQPARGTVTIDAATGAYTYTPAADYHGADSFVVAISDGHGGMVQSTVSLTVTPVADIAPDTVTTVEDTRVNIAINANDTFENAGHAVSAINGTAVTVGVPIAVSNGMVTLQADGTLDFQPAANFNGATSFSYTVTSGGTSETATVNVTVTAQNDVPVPIDPGNPQYPAQNFDPDSGDYSLVTPEDTPVSGQVVATDADGDTLIYVVVTPPAHGTLAFDSATGEYSYTPNQDFNGKDSFVVAIDDGKGGTTETTVNIEVTPVNDPPLPADPQSPSQNFDPATGDYSLVTPEDVPVDGKIVAIDPDGDPLTYTAGIPPANGTMVVHPDGTYTYTPARDFNGEDSFTVVIDDGKGGTTTTTVNVTVTPVQDVPVVVDPKVPGQNFDPITDTSTLTTPQDTPIDGRVVVEDPDGDMLTYETVTPPAHGTVVVKPDGSFTYTPNPGFNGDDSFVVMVDDGHGNRVPAVVDVKVVPTAARDDYPFVFLPEGGNGEAGERSNGAAHTEVEPAVLGDAVDRIDSLASVPALRAGGAVLQAVNGVRSLDGTASLDVGGAVLTAVNGVDSLKSIDAPAEQRDDLQRTLGGSAGDGAVQPTMISSLHLEGGGLALNLVAGGPQVWIDVTGRGDVRAIQAFGPEGSALPDWVRVDSRGHISIDRPADVERLRMRLEVQRERGAGSSHLIEIDFNSGQMRVLKDAGEGAAKPARGQSSGTRAAPDFATQLARAADRRDPMDAALLELLS